MVHPYSKSLHSPSPWTFVTPMAAVCGVQRHLHSRHLVRDHPDFYLHSAPPFGSSIFVSSAPKPIVVQPAPSASECNIQQTNTTTLNTKAVTTFNNNGRMTGTQVRNEMRKGDNENNKEGRR